MSDPSLVFREVSPGRFARSIVGIEQLSARSGDFDGSMHTTFSCSIMLAQPAPASFRQNILYALVRLRYAVPTVACTLSQLPSYSYEFKYEVPKTSDDALAWAEAVLFFDDRSGESFEQLHDRLALNRYWETGAGKNVMEFHVSKEPTSSTSWTFVLSAPHPSLDGRTGFMVFETLFSFLSDELTGCGSKISQLAWGRETQRLSPAAPVVWSLAQTGDPGTLPSLASLPPPPQPAGVIPFTVPNKYYDVDGIDRDNRATIKLTRDQTSQLHSVCKAHGCTITQCVYSLLILSNVESSLRLACHDGQERFEEVLKGYHCATHFAVPFSAVNFRPKMPEAYRTFEGELGTPMYSVALFPMIFPLSTIKTMIHVDDSNKSIQGRPDKETFWTGVVKEVADAWHALDTSIDAYRAFSTFTTAIATAETFSMQQFETSPPIYSSFGDLSRLSILEAFRPSAANTVITVNDVAFGMRQRLPCVGAYFLQYDGQIRISLHCGGRFSSQGDVETHAQVVREWLDVALSG